MDQPQRTAPGIVPGFNISSMLSLLTMSETNHGPQQVPQPMQPTVQLGFPFNITHNTNFLLIPAHERQSIRIVPTLMANIAGYCDHCGKCSDQIALETLGEYLVATEYAGETIKERAIRSRAFIHGFEAALFIFKKCGIVASLTMR